ncbi:hypothetical protein V8E54_012644 [Elaphomyces granulatus]
MPFSRRLYSRPRVSRLADKPAEAEAPYIMIPTAEPVASIEEPEPFLSSKANKDLDDKIDPHDARITNFPIDLDLQELEQADQCDDDIAVTSEVDPALDALPVQPFNSEEEIQTIQPTAISSQTISTSPISHLGVQASDDDDSELIKHVRATDRGPLRFQVAFGLCQEAGISRSLYSSLLEILRMPESSQAPIMSLDIEALQPEQLGKEKSAAGLSSTGLREDLYFFDPIAVFTAFLRSDIYNQMHITLGKFYDNPQELWHSHAAWRSSIRTSSGQFAHYPDGKPIFP